MKCNFCGTENDISNSFCKKCGSPLVGNSHISYDAGKQKRGGIKPWYLLVAGVVLVAIIISIGGIKRQRLAQEKKEVEALVNRYHEAYSVFDFEEMEDCCGGGMKDKVANMKEAYDVVKNSPGKTAGDIKDLLGSLIPDSVKESEFGKAFGNLIDDTGDAAQKGYESGLDTLVSDYGYSFSVDNVERIGDKSYRVESIYTAKSPYSPETGIESLDIRDDGDGFKIVASEMKSD